MIKDTINWMIMPILLMLLTACESRTITYTENPTCGQLNTIDFDNAIIVFADQTERFKKEFMAKEEFLDQVKKKKNFIFIGYDKCPIITELYKKYEIKYFPTIVETDKKGNTVYRAFGMPYAKSFYNDIFDKKEDSKRDFATFYFQENEDIDQRTMDVIDSGYWLIDGELRIINRKLNNSYYSYLSIFPGWTSGKTKSGKNYEITRRSNFNVNLKWGNSTDDFTYNDWYVNGNHQMIFSTVYMVEKDGTINPTVKVDTLDFNMKNKDEFVLQRGESILTFKRDTTEQWKSF